jgi:hypothetical protein
VAATGLRWEAVPDSEVEGTAVASQDEDLPVATLVWEPVPAQEVIEPRRAIAESLEGPDPGALPEQAPPAVPKIRGVARSITVNGLPYPDVGLFVPNGFAMDPEFTVSAILDGVNRTRSCRVPDGGNWLDCADTVAYLEVTPLNLENFSAGLQWSVQSLTARNQGTATFAGQSLGFRLAWNLTPTTGIAFGGEHIIQFDDTVDLGRNFYLVLSQGIPLGRGTDPAMLVGTVGIGSDFYGFGNTEGNGTLGSTDCLSGNNISSPTFPEGRDCYWGPIGSLSLALNSRVAIGAEWFGYGFGAGISLRPFRELPVTFSLYATDFLGNTPDYIQEGCTTDPCEARYYGKLTVSF